MPGIIPDALPFGGHSWAPPVPLQTIQDTILSTLNRSTDPVITAIIPQWILNAYLEIQRIQNFACMQSTQYLSAADGTLTASSDVVLAPENLKEIRRVFLYDEVNKKIVRVWTQQGIEDIDEVQYDSQESDVLDEQRTAIFALEENYIHLHPPLPSDLTNLVLGVRAWRFLLPPINLQESDFFTNVCPDYLMYHCLVQSAPYLGADKRIETWQKLLATARAGAISMGVQQVAPGPLIMRG